MKKRSYLIFALLDLFTVSYYLSVQLWNERIPLYSDWLQMIQSAENSGLGGVIYTLSLPIFLIYPTLLLSTWFYFKQYNQVKWLALLQTPLRTTALVSSIPFFYETLSWFAPKASNTLSELPIMYYGFILILGLLIEIGKNIFLFKQK